MYVINNVFVAGCSIPYKLAAAPEVTMQEMCLTAARDVIEKSGIDKSLVRSVFLGTMGGFTATPSEMAVSVCSELELEPYRISQEKDTSSTGASVLFDAYQDVAYGPTDKSYVLVLAGEAMFDPIPGGKKTPKIKEQMKNQSLKNTGVLSGVIGKKDRQYGLTMPLIGDMLETRLMEKSSFTSEEWKEIIFPAVRKQKMTRGQAFLNAHFRGKKFDLEKFQKAPMITPQYSRNTMVPQSSGIVAMLLTNEKPECKNGKYMRIRSIGQGFTSPLLTKRKGPLLFPEAIYRSLGQLCQRSGLSPEDLKNVDCRFDHDAFKAIERLNGFILGETETTVINNMLDGKNNPFGGLEISGHAIGASGLLQVAQAYMMVTEDTDYIDKASLPLKYSNSKTILCSSVGAALTNMFFSFLEIYDEGEEPKTSYRFNKENFNEFLPKERIFDEYSSKLDKLKLGKDDGIILTYTLPNMNFLEFFSDFDVYVTLVQMKERKVFALSKKIIPIGGKVKIDTSSFPFKIVKKYAQKVKGTDPMPLKSFHIEPSSSKERKAILAHCKKILK
ncbi:hypothetical protein KAJ27_08900 [bacterium]|nr:hypothetical protein [bacterium]